MKWTHAPWLLALMMAFASAPRAADVTITVNGKVVAKPCTVSTANATVDLGDLYSLSLQWLELLDRRRSARLELLDEDDWDDGGVPAQIPDEVQVENRMERVLERLTAFSEGLSLRSLLKEEPGRGALVVTLLALLELSRRNFVTLVQKELFGDVFITARRA